MAVAEAPVDAAMAEALAAAAGPVAEALRAVWEGLSPEARAIIGDPSLAIQEKRIRLAALVPTVD